MWYPRNMEIKIQAFKDGEYIPKAHSCDGKDVVPTVVIKGVPPKASSLALIIDDPDATGGDVWNHCVLYNIPPDTKEIHANSIQSLQSGVNSWGKEGYGGPCPPKDDAPHRYVFTLYALDAELTFKKPPSAEQVAHTMKKHILKEMRYIGLYSRK